MPLGNTVKFANNYDRGNPCYSSSLSGFFVSAIDAGGMTSADAATIVTPGTTITASTCHIISVDPWQGTNLVFSACYDATATTPANGTYAVFGRYNNGVTAGPWRRLCNRAGNKSRTPGWDTTYDSSDGTLKYTTPDAVYDVFDRLNYNEILVGIESAHTVASGSAALACLQVGCF